MLLRPIVFEKNVKKLYNVSSASKNTFIGNIKMDICTSLQWKMHKITTVHIEVCVRPSCNDTKRSFGLHLLAIHLRTSCFYNVYNQSCRCAHMHTSFCAVDVLRIFLHTYNTNTEVHVYNKDIFPCTRFDVKHFFFRISVENYIL